MSACLRLTDIKKFQNLIIIDSADKLMIYMFMNKNRI